ncbi:type II 3-dehydroquinate dehydratase [Enterobacteriaceae endosymbiont of Macroplea appendiculata]|uniref:type II 3-dehydroquinate dehydratase n=1 Tax=Enterobacteriaceae endosymbiont of Macroplea appendiculata TaxID=2675790 RepID=UPI001449724F|nr:type II 3-dehydroquinate dehydratase [Enterobacteriaceae endosymbiont of Macroplea appendiculata]QJC30642.1 type II 3-dehydroquinate dehydratase [Enterobacteriaceae endosymbiont of Macroplea appendiculata]
MYRLKYHILIVNGPNLSLLGQREPEKYGNISLKTIISNLSKLANKKKCMLTHIQSNAEHILIDYLIQHSKHINYIIINPGAFTHTSIALRDTILAIQIPFIEVHITNIYKREKFRQKSFFSDIAQGVIIGCGIEGYNLALHVIFKKLGL